MNVDYLLLKTYYNDTCSNLTIEFSPWVVIPPYSTKSQKFSGADALQILKTYEHGLNPDLNNYGALLFAPDVEIGDLPYDDLTVVTPNLSDVEYKKNRFQNRKRKLNGESMTFVCVDNTIKSVVDDSSTPARASEPLAEQGESQA